MRVLGLALFLAGFSLWKPLAAAPMITVGNAVYFHVKADAEYQYLSNLTLSTDPNLVKDDSLFKFTPGLRLSLFEESDLTHFSFGVERSLLHFLTETFFNDEPWRLNMRAGYDGHPFSFSTGWNKAEMLQNISTASGFSSIRSNSEIVRTIAEQFNINFKFSFTQKTGMRTGLDWSVTDFTNPTYLDYDATSVPLSVFYKFTEKLESSIGYRYRFTEISSGTEHRDHYLNLKLLGHVTPKTDLQLTLGFQNRNSDYFGNPQSLDTNAFSANLGVNYQATGKIGLSAGLFRDFNIGSSLGETIEYTSANVGSNIQISPTFSFAGTASVWKADYSVITREDFGVNGRAGFTFAPTDSVWTFRTGYNFDWAEFDIFNSITEYTNHKVSLSTNWEY